MMSQTSKYDCTVKLDEKWHLTSYTVRTATSNKEVNNML